MHVRRYTGYPICAVPCDGRDDLCADFSDEQCDSAPFAKAVACLAVGMGACAAVHVGHEKYVGKAAKRVAQSGTKTAGARVPVSLLLTVLTEKTERCLKLKTGRNKTTTYGSCMNLLPLQVTTKTTASSTR